jgi:NADPH:quinone reductase
VRALQATGDANALVKLGDVDDPAPAPDEALVTVQAFSLNRGECRRLLGASPGWVAGWDVAGTIAAAAADGSGPAEGTRVVGLVQQGAWAERVAVRTDRLCPLPDGMSFQVASTLPVAGLTALLALRRGGQLLGKRVAVTGATGGVGPFALQIAALSGAHTTAIVSSPDRTEGLPARGVDQVEVGLDEDGPPFDVILDSVGGPLLAGALARINPGGAIVTYGNSSAQPTTFNVMGFYRRNAAALSGFFLFAELDADPPGGRHLATLADLVAEGRIDVGIDMERRWEDGSAVVRALLDRKVRGKAVLTLG